MENINIPPKGKSTGRKPKYNLQNIEQGCNATFIADSNIRQAVAQYAKRTNKKFACRKQGESIVVYRIN
mgnify:CR=1 FL=1